MKVICNCGQEMICNVYVPDQDTNFEGYDCPTCDASFYGKTKKGKEKGGYTKESWNELLKSTKEVIEIMKRNLGDE